MRCIDVKLTQYNLGGHFHLNLGGHFVHAVMASEQNWRGSYFLQGCVTHAAVPTLREPDLGRIFVYMACVCAHHAAVLCFRHGVLVAPINRRPNPLPNAYFLEELAKTTGPPHSYTNIRQATRGVATARVATPIPGMQRWAGRMGGNPTPFCTTALTANLRSRSFRGPMASVNIWWRYFNSICPGNGLSRCKSC